MVAKNDLDGEMAQHLKRLSRKDPTTKVMLCTICHVIDFSVLNYYTFLLCVAGRMLNEL